ncbi:hypothetical protein [Xanthocytophaga flava]|uniref:hypothetical protein n=1 Tax=Xanthocytophaga flava TaxID=3048013 RepID=UPI0028D37FC1|nr:hypothetical protein [Xanthocytophaga flavus]MDJ1469647.1 hypothetical protein [Xanthocytophaga flavus]
MSSHTSQSNVALNQNSDSLIVAKYRLALIRGYMEDDSLVTESEMDSILQEMRISLSSGEVFYAPDSTFKIYVIEGESCGGYCNPLWSSYIHYNLKSKQVIKEADFTSITSIHKLPDEKYVIMEHSYGRPASVMSVVCNHARVISFQNDSILTHSIGNNSEGKFEFCQQNTVQLEEEPYIRYDLKSKRLTYLYGNNYGYSHDLDIDTIRQGQFQYVNGKFILEKETITVNDRSQTEDK